MSIPSRLTGVRVSPHELYKGKGYIGGDLPPDPNPDELDGRAKIANVPSRVRVFVYERITMRCIASRTSAPDGTWRVGRLATNRNFVVIGFDDTGQHNAAIQDWVVPELEP